MAIFDLASMGLAVGAQALSNNAWADFRYPNQNWFEGAGLSALGRGRLFPKEERSMLPLLQKSKDPVADLPL